MELKKMEFIEVRKVRQELYDMLSAEEPFKQCLDGCRIERNTWEERFLIKVDLKMPLPEGAKLPTKYRGVEIVVGVIGETEDRQGSESIRRVKDRE